MTDNISDYDIENESIISLSFDGGKDIIIFVKGILGNTFTLNVQTLYNISMIKKIIYLREGIDENDQRLTFRGQQLEDHKTLEYYNVRNESTFHLVLRLRGG